MKLDAWNTVCFSSKKIIFYSIYFALKIHFCESWAETQQHSITVKSMHLWTKGKRIYARKNALNMAGPVSKIHIWHGSDSSIYNYSKFLRYSGLSDLKIWTDKIEWWCLEQKIVSKAPGQVAKVEASSYRLWSAV